MRPFPRMRVINRHLRHLRHRTRFINELWVTRSIFQSSPAFGSCVTGERVFNFAGFLVRPTQGGGDGSGDGWVTINPDDASPLMQPVFRSFLASATAGDEGDAKHQPLWSPLHEWDRNRVLRDGRH